jgi:hypothetical protein
MEMGHCINDIGEANDGLDRLEKLLEEAVHLE